MKRRHKPRKAGYASFLQDRIQAAQARGITPRAAIADLARLRGRRVYGETITKDKPAARVCGCGAAIPRNVAWCDDCANLRN